jgi:predicted choloylglycine hydrolase
MTFTAINEDFPGPKWCARWDLAWPSYRSWFIRKSDQRDTRSKCEQNLLRHMPELFSTYSKFVALVGGGDLEAQFLSQWNPPEYLVGCSIAAIANDHGVRLVRNYDLAPHLNEGLLINSAWTGTRVMGMSEFLWGLSDGINGHGLCVALAFGGRTETSPGFGIALIVRYILETCKSTGEALEKLRCIPSHMAYNLTIADRNGLTASVELRPGGGCQRVWPAIATNHQNGPHDTRHHKFTQTFRRRAHLQSLIADKIEPHDLAKHFVLSPLVQRDYDAGFGTLFTAEYDPQTLKQSLIWPRQKWVNTLSCFQECQATVALQDLVSIQDNQVCDYWDGQMSPIATHHMSGFRWQKYCY